MGITHSTPPCVGNVLGPPGRVPQSEIGGGWRDDRPSSAPGAPQRLSLARKRRSPREGGGVEERERPWPRPLLGPHIGGGATAPGPALLRMVAKPWKPFSAEVT